MKRISTIITVAIVAVVFSFNVAVACDKKHQVDEPGVNPSGKYVNTIGKAYWKQGDACTKKHKKEKRKNNRTNWKQKAADCAETSAAQETEIISLISENADLLDRIADLEAQLVSMKEVQQQVLMAAPVVEAAPAESRKFAINKYTDGNYGIYTNDFMLTDDTKEKLESMVPGLYRIQVKVLNVETDIEVIIETETEAYDFEKRGHEWFIGKTING